LQMARFTLPSAHDLSLKYWFWICQTRKPFVRRKAGNILNNTSDWSTAATPIAEYWLCCR
jgi:hypothetical protein